MDYTYGEKVILFFPAVRSCWSYFCYKIYLALVTNKRILFIYLRDFLSRRNKVELLIRAFIGGLIGRYFLGDPGIVAGVGMMTEDFLENFEVELSVDSIPVYELDRLLGDRRSFSIKLSSIRDIEIRYRKPTLTLKTRWRKYTFYIPHQVLADVSIIAQKIVEESR